VTSHRLKLGLFPPNEVGRIAQHLRKGEGKKEGKDGVGLYHYIPAVLFFPFIQMSSLDFISMHLYNTVTFLNSAKKTAAI
jgi:hypothetical protein